MLVFKLILMVEVRDTVSVVFQKIGLMAKTVHKSLDITDVM